MRKLLGLLGLMVVPTLVEAQANPNQLAILRWYDANQAGNSFAVGQAPTTVAFDGANIWVANYNGKSVTKLRASDGSLVGTYALSAAAYGIAFDGANVWVTTVTTSGVGSVTKLRTSDGSVVGTYAVGSHAGDIAFDGANIWVAIPDNGGSVAKLRASDGS